MIEPSLLDTNQDRHHGMDGPGHPTRFEALNTYKGWARWVLLIDTCVPLQAQLSRLFWWPLATYLRGKEPDPKESR